ncbi:MAG: DUF5312 domain-containing protein [Treponema sp.]|jgi:hypothetical protein|nr:DUF5312 domain-containing protein [Treponema sp.]
MAAGWFSRLLSFFWGDKGGKGSEGKRHLVKRLNKELAANRFARFYHPKLLEVQPEMGKFFRNMYVTLVQAQAFLQNIEKSSRLKQITVETFLDMKYLDARQRLNIEYIEKEAKLVPIAEVSRLLKEDLAILASAFDGDSISRIDGCYNQILSLAHLVNFDYFFFLRKFNSGIVERNFSAVPRFSPVPGLLLIEGIKDFLEVAYPVDPDLDWTMPLQVLRVYKNDVDALAMDEWTTLLGNLRELRRSSILELIVQHITRDFQWKFKPRTTHERIAAAYMEECRKEANQAFSGFLHTQKQNQVAVLAKELFGSTDVNRIVHYTEKDNEAFVSKGLSGFVHAKSLNYLKAFMVDFFQADIQEICELFMVQGIWASPERAKELTNLFHVLAGNMEQMLALEQSLSETGEIGTELRITLVKSGKNPKQLWRVDNLLQKLNTDTAILLSSTAEALILLGKLFRDILQNAAKRENPVLVNYRTLQLKENDLPLTQCLVLSYKRILCYLRIQQLLTNRE